MAKMTNPKARAVERTIRLPRDTGRRSLWPGLSVVSAGVMPRKREWINHRFNAVALGWVRSGQGSYQADAGKPIPVRAGSTFCVYPGPLFRYGPDPGTTWHECYIIVDGPAIDRLFRRGLLFRDGSVRHVGNIPGLLERWTQLAAVSRDREEDSRDRALVAGLGILLDLAHAGRQSQSQSHADPLVARAQAMLKDRLASHTDFQSLATELGVSYSTLRQKFRQSTEAGPAQWLARVRCEAARQLLADTDLAVKQIAQEVGVPDAFTFSRLFKRHTGQSPLGWRKQARPFSVRP
jgi:AraC-like DNA-binding protein